MRVTTNYLDNGMQWISVEDPKSSEFRLVVSSRNGEEREWRKRQRGMTHLLEHIMFRDKDLENTKELFYTMEDAGVLANGTTVRHNCDLYWYGPTRSRQTKFDLARHGLTFDYDALSAAEKEIYITESLNKEKDRVRNELLERMCDSKWVELEYMVAKELYNSSPYGQTYKDQLHSVDDITAEQLFALRSRIFNPGNLTIITISALNESRVRKQVERAFGDLPEGNPYKPVRYTLPPRREQRRDWILEGSTTNFVDQTLRCGPATREQLALLYVLNQVIGTNETSPLYMAMSTIAAQTYTLKSEMIVSRPEMLLSIRYSCMDHHIDSNLETVSTHLQQLAEKRLPRSDFDRYQMLAVNAFIRDTATDDATLGSWLADMAALGVYGRNGRVDRVLSPKELIREVRATTPLQLMHFIKDSLPGMVTVVFRPGDVENRLRPYTPS